MSMRYRALLISAAILLLMAGISWKFGRQLWTQKPPRGSNRPELGVENGELSHAGKAANRDAPRSQGPFDFRPALEGSGIDFRHESGTSTEKPLPAFNGSGVAALDFDLDGNYDLYFLTGTPFPVDQTRARPVNRIYRNLGDWKFEDVTRNSGLGHNGYSAGVAVGDYDADGFPDVYVACYGANRLYHNQGDGTFLDVTESAGCDDQQWATSVAFLDADADGLLDLYVCNYAKWSLKTNRFCGDRARNVRTYCHPNMVAPAQDVYYHNEGDGTFRDASDEVGLESLAARAQGVVAADFNDDGFIDLYLGNDQNPNTLLLNDRHGKFLDASETSGLAYDHSGRVQGGMGVDAADANRDGRIDLFVTNYENEHNAYYENFDEGFFQELSDSRGLAAASLPWVGWGTAFVDFDRDGWVDLFVTNGHVDDNLHLLGLETPYAEPPLVWRNIEGRFASQGASAGSYFARHHVGRGLAVVDLDNDGDSDLVISHMDERPELLRNECIAPPDSKRSWIRLQLVGTRSNRDAVGSTLTLQSVAPMRVQQIKGGGSYLSAHDLRQILAVDATVGEYRVEIRWPSQIRSLVTDLEPGNSYFVIEPTNPSDPPRVVKQRRRTPLRQDN